MRRLVVLGLVLASGCALRTPTAAIPQDQWSRVTAVGTGMVLRVHTRDPSGAQRVEGTLAAVDQFTIELTTARGPIQLARRDVRQVDLVLPGPDGVKNGALIGAIAGAAYGIIVVRETEDGILGSRAGVALASAATGALFGALVDWMVPKARVRTIYRV